MARDGKPPRILIGHSLGGAAVLMAAGEMPAMRAVATLGAPFDTRHVLHPFDPESLQTTKAHGQAEENGRASCRERVSPYGRISVGEGSYKKKNTTINVRPEITPL